jgi:two-component system KDP operon response regulator KdpE
MTTTTPLEPTSVRVLVVDDDQLLGDALSSALESLGHRVRLARTAATGRELARETDPDVVVVDLGLPDADGLELLGEIRDQSAVPVLVLTGSTDPARRVEALDAGADDFLGKPFRLAELEARLRALARRPELRSSTVTVHGAVTVDRVARTVTVEGRPVHLTPIEWRLLDALVARAGLVVSHRALIDAGWSDRHGAETVESLRVHIRSLRSKLADAEGSTPLRTEAGVGYRWQVPHTPPAGSPAVPSGSAAAAAGPAPHADTAVGSGVRRTEAERAAHDLHNALTALEVATFMVGAEGAEAGVSAAARESALQRLPALAVRIRELADRLVTTSVPGHDPDRTSPQEDTG